MCLLSTDAKRAFDIVNWGFMHETLKHIGLETNIFSWSSSLYSSPSELVKVFGSFSSPFPFSNGTWQVCPFSLLIFILCLESLLHYICSNHDIRGVSLDGTSHKVIPFPNDLLFFLTSPLNALPNHIVELHRHASLSNFLINYQKSEALSVSLKQTLVSELMDSFSFKWSRVSFKYLGICLTGDLWSLYTINYLPLLQCIRADLDSLSKGLFTWFGSCTILKINILPRNLYLYRALLVHVPCPFFKALMSMMSRFVWADKPARIAHSTLFFYPKHDGGIGFIRHNSLPPDFTFSENSGLVQTWNMKAMDLYETAIYHHSTPGDSLAWSADPFESSYAPH